MQPQTRKLVRRCRLATRFLGLLAFLILICTCHQARALKLLAPTWFGMHPLTNGIYVDKAMPAEQRDQILQTVSQGKDRVARYYGSVTSRPNLFFYSTREVFQSFGGGGETGLTLLGRACLFPPVGQNVPIVAHEWSHAEFESRIGLWRWCHVPDWFDEGLAVTVSEEPRHSESVYQKALASGASPPPLSELVTLRQWKRAVKKYRDPKLNPDKTALVYATAGHEVRKWFDRAQTVGLRQLCNDLGAGTDFATAYPRAASE